MGEDIKILEKLKDRMEDIGFGDKSSVCTCQEQLAIENLIRECRKLQECINKEHQSGYSQGIYDSSEAWKETIEEIKTENEKRIDEMRPYKHQAPFDFGVLNGIDECCRKLLEGK